MELSKRHKQFLLIEQGASPTIPNLVINVLITWLINRSSSTIPVWGAKSVAQDLMASGFLLPFLVCLIVSPLVARQVRSGKLPPLPLEQLPFWRWFRFPVWVRGLYLGILGVLFGALPLVWALSIGQARPFPVGSFILFKAVWASMLALLITPIVAWWALANASLTARRRTVAQPSKR